MFSAKKPQPSGGNAVPSQATDAHLHQGTDGPLSRVISAQAWAAALLTRALAGARAARSFALPEVHRVLVVHLFEIGDMVWLSPFLRELRRMLPDAEITLMVKPEARSLVANCPHVNEVMAYDADVARAWRPLVLPWRAFWTARRRLRPRRFDLALVPSLLADNSYASFLACFSGAPWRVGYAERITDRRRRLNRGFDRLFTGTVDEITLEHDIRHNLALIPFLGGTVESEALEIWLDEDDEAFARAFLAEHGVAPGEALAALCPTAGHSALKQWPLEHFVRLARWLHEEKGMRVLVVGGPGDAAQGAAFDEALGPAVINAVGRTTLRQMAALLKGCRCFVGGDAGPTHMAPALDVPTVALFGASCHHRAGPWGAGRPHVLHQVVAHDIPCSPCGSGHRPGADFRCPVCILDEPHCMTGITVEEVQRAVAQALLTPGRRLPLARENR